MMADIWILDEPGLPLGDGGITPGRVAAAAETAGLSWEKVDLARIAACMETVPEGTVLATAYGESFPDGLPDLLVRLQRRRIHLALLGAHPLLRPFQRMGARRWAALPHPAFSFNCINFPTIPLERLHLLGMGMDLRGSRLLDEAKSIRLTASGQAVMSGIPMRIKKTGLADEIFCDHPDDRRIALVVADHPGKVLFKHVAAGLLEHGCTEFAGSRIVWACFTTVGSPLAGWPLDCHFIAGLLCAARNGVARADAEDIDTCRPAWRAPRRPVDRPRIEVQRHNGRPTLMLDGKPTFVHAYMFDPLSNCLARDLHLMSGTGIHIYSFLAPLFLGWHPDRFDFDWFDRLARRIMSADPQALLLPRVFPLPPDWWLKQNPDELVRLDSGTEGLDRRGFRFTAMPNPSFASAIWLRDAEHALRAFAAHACAADYGHRFLGACIGCGPCGEWSMWGLSGDYRIAGDQSVPMAIAFRAWLRQRYAADIEALRAAWRQPDITFEAVTIPGEEERFRTSLGHFYDRLETQRLVMDYRQFLNDLGSDLLIAFSRALKEGAGGNALAGALFAYNFEPGWNERGGEHGMTHFAGRRVLQSPSVDFFSTPMSYQDRRLDTGDGSFMGILDSVRLHGKLWIGETDTRTYLTARPGKNIWGPDTVEESQAILLRDFGTALTKDVDLWWYDFGAGWYVDPLLLSTLKRCDQVGRQALERSHCSTTQIAALTNIESLSATRTVGIVTELGTSVMRLRHLSRIGAPWHACLIDDLPAMSRYRVFVMSLATYLTEEQRAGIRAHQRQGNVFIWTYAPATVSAQGLDLAASEDLTGIRLRLERSARSLDVRLSRFDHPYTAGLSGEEFESFGMTLTQPLAHYDYNKVYSEMYPVFVPDDSRVTVLGVFKANGDPAFCVRKMEGWTSVYCAGPLIPWQILRNICRAEGVHLYSQTGDVVRADNRFVLITTGSVPGAREIRLPAPVRRVTNVMTRRAIAEGNVESFVFRAKARRTYWFALDPCVPGR